MFEQALHFFFFDLYSPHVIHIQTKQKKKGKNPWFSRTKQEQVWQKHHKKKKTERQSTTHCLQEKKIK